MKNIKCIVIIHLLKIIFGIFLCVSTSQNYAQIKQMQLFQEQSPGLASLQQKTVITDQLLASAIASTLPALSYDDKNKLFLYKKLFTTVALETSEKTLQSSIDNFIANIVNVALIETNFSLQNLIETKTTTDGLISTLAIMVNSLNSVTNVDARRVIISQSIQILKNKTTLLATKISKQVELAKNIENIKKIPNDKLSDQLLLYKNILPKIDIDSLDSIKNEFIAKFIAFFKIAFAQKSSLTVDLQEIVNKIQTSPYFSIQQKLDFSIGLQQKSIGPTSIALHAVATKIKLDVVFQNKYNEVLGKKTLIEKIKGSQELLVLITAATMAEEKNMATTLCNDLFLQQGLMKKIELVELKTLLSSFLNNQYLLAVNQQEVLKNWIVSITDALVLVEEHVGLMQSIKNKLNSFNATNNQPSSLIEVLKFSFFALSLLDTKLPIVEFDKNKKDSMVGVLRNILPLLYNARSNRTVEEIAGLKNLFDTVKKNKYLVDVLTKEWEAKIAITLALVSIQKQTNILAKIDELEAIAKMMQSSVDSYEKRIFFNEIERLVKGRGQYAEIEIEKLQKILITLTSAIFKKNKIFDDADIKKLNEFRSITYVTQVLLMAFQEKILYQKIKGVGNVLSMLVGKDVSYEKTLLMKFISEIFVNRAFCVRSDIEIIISFFKTIREMKNLLAANQLSVLVVWLQELNYALTVTNGEKTYIESLLDSAIAIANTNLIPQTAVIPIKATIQDEGVVGKLVKILTLCSYECSEIIKNKFINCLNILFQKRKNLNRTEFLDLLAMVKNKTIKNQPFLSKKQLDFLLQWIQIVSKE